MFQNHVLNSIIDGFVCIVEINTLLATLVVYYFQRMHTKPLIILYIKNGTAIFNTKLLLAHYCQICGFVQNVAWCIAFCAPLTESLKSYRCLSFRFISILHEHFRLYPIHLHIPFFQIRSKLFTN